MTIAFTVGQYDVRFSVTPEDLTACQSLRHLCFFFEDGIDADRFDPLCRHLMVHKAGELVATCRLMLLTSGASIDMSYAAQRYDLSSLEPYQGRMLEIGRFCIAPTTSDPDVLRLCWGAIAQLVDLSDIGFIFGCTSFEGTDLEKYRQAFELLADSYGPPAYFPIESASNDCEDLESGLIYDRKVAVGQLPALLRSYLSLGAWVSDHAVVDREMNTIHVFTGLEVEKIPASKAQALRSIVPVERNPLAENAWVA